MIKRPHAALSCALAVAVAPAWSAVAAAQNVAGWVHEASEGKHYAYYTTPSTELSVSCKGADVEVFFYLAASALDPVLKGRTSAVLAVTMDTSTEFQWKQTALFIEPDVASIGIGGPEASRLAHEFAEAITNVTVAILTTVPNAVSVPYNATQFPTFGAADAIKAAYAGCGIKF